VSIAVEGVLVAGLTLVCAAWALQLWHADLGVPLRYAPVDDTKFYLMLVKGIIDHGWYLANSSLGAPFGQRLADYPQGGDNLSLLMIRGLALFSANPALVMNLFFLLTFALVGLSCHFALRRLGVSAPVAAVVSVLFSLLPYHFFRGESQLLLAAYYSVPLSALLFLELLDGRPMFDGWRGLATVGLCLVIGSANIYYATFGLVLIAAATVIEAVLRRWRSARDGLAIVALVLATLAVNLAPSFLYEASHGSNPAVARTATDDQRSPYALDLRPANLIVPVPDSRISPLRRLATGYDHAVAPAYCESCYASLGAVGTVGLGWLALSGLGTLAGAIGWFGALRLIRHASLGAAIALAFGTVGGLSSVFEFLISPDIRAWNRISVLIAFMSLLAVALLLDALVARCRRRRGGAVLAAALLVGLLGFGVFEQTTSEDVPAYAATTRQWRSDAVFVGEIQNRLPAGASVFQLPYVPFPEGYPNTRVGGALATYATKYEPLRGYLHSTTLRWSYGAVKGRPADWAAQLAGQPLSFVTAAVTAAGFDGLWVDPAGFEPVIAQRVKAALRTLLRVSPLVSPDRDLWFFDLRPYRARLERSYPPAQLGLLRERTLHPLRAACAAGGLALVNPSGAPRAATLTVHLADGRTVSRRLSLAPGRSVLRISAGVLYAALTDAALAPFERGQHGRAGSLVAGLTGPPCHR
jgi:phosphoglycerol transferase